METKQLKPPRREYPTDPDALQPALGQGREALGACQDMALLALDPLAAIPRIRLCRPRGTTWLVLFRSRLDQGRLCK